MRYVLAAAIAAAVSWTGNRAALKIMGTKVIVITGPLLEEIAKTGTAVLMNCSVVLTHSTFGLIEGIYDAWGRGLEGIKAGAVSFLGHLFYGYITFLIVTKSNNFIIAVLTGYTVHMLWNLAVMKFVVTRRRASQ